MVRVTFRCVVAVVMLLCLGLPAVPASAQSKSYDPPLSAGKQRVYTKDFTAVVDAVRKVVSGGPRELVSEESAGPTTRVVNARYRPSFTSSRPAYAGPLRVVIESTNDSRVAVRVHWPANPNDADLVFRDLETLLR